MLGSWDVKGFVNGVVDQWVVVLEVSVKVVFGQGCLDGEVGVFDGLFGLVVEVVSVGWELFF